MTLAPESIERVSENTSGFGVLARSGGLACVLLSALLFVFNTRHGIGVLPDSTRYMNIGPTPYDAPGYPWVLESVMAFGLARDSAARLIGLAFACANTALIWQLLVRTTPGYSYALAGTLLIVLSPVFVYFHATAMSEPLFIFLILVSLVCLHRYGRGHGRIWIVGCGLAIGAAALTRFTAPPLAVAVAAAVLLDPRQRLARRMVDAAIVCILSGGMFFVWLIVSEMMVGRATGRALAFEGNLGAANWLVSLAAANTMLLPSQIPAMVRNGVLVLVLVATIYVVARYAMRFVQNQPAERSGKAGLLPLALGIFLPLYLAFFWLATQIEANLFLNGRYSLPVFVTTVLAATMAVPALSPGHGRIFQRILTLFVLVVLAAHAVRTADETHGNYRKGIGYAALAWTNSPVMRAVSRLPATAEIYSNGPDAVGYVAGRPAKFIPLRWMPRTGKDNPANPYGKQIETLRARLAAGDCYVVLLDRVDWRAYTDSEENLKNALGLKLVVSLPDGRIYAGETAKSEGVENGPGA